MRFDRSQKLAQRTEDISFFRAQLQSKSRQLLLLREQQTLYMQAGERCSEPHHLLIFSCVTSTVCNMLWFVSCLEGDLPHGFADVQLLLSCLGSLSNSRLCEDFVCAF